MLHVTHILGSVYSKTLLLTINLTSTIVVLNKLNGFQKRSTFLTTTERKTFQLWSQPLKLETLNHERTYSNAFFQLLAEIVNAGPHTAYIAATIFENREVNFPKSILWFHCLLHSQWWIRWRTNICYNVENHLHHWDTRELNVKRWRVHKNESKASKMAITLKNETVKPLSD